MSSSTSTKRGPYASSLKRRLDIAQAVLDIVDDEGHDAVTTALVAARSGTSEPTVMYHFPTKDHLLVAAMERADDLTALETGADVESTVLDVDALKNVASNGNVHDNRARLLQLIRGQSATPGHPASEYLQRRTQHQLEIFSRLIAARQAEGLAHPNLDRTDAARQIIALWDGLTMMWMNDPSFDIGASLADAVRRITGENVMGLRSLISQEQLGL